MALFDVESSAPHLVHVFSSFAVGGAQARFATIANALGGKYRHSVVALDGDVACAERLDRALAVEWRAMKLTKGSLRIDNLWRLRAFLRRARADLLLTYNWGAIETVLANRLAPLCPHLHFEDGFGPDETVDRQRRRRVWTRRLALSGPHTTVIVPSRGLCASAVKDWGVAKDRVLYVPNGVDVARFSGDSSAKSDSGGCLTIVWLGGLRPEKNLKFLLRALAGLEGLRLRLIGDGPERAALTAEAIELGIGERVEFLGARSAPESELRAADIFVLPSLTEQMPLSLIEAMAAGLPVVATDVGDVADMVAPENRPLIMPVGDLEGFRAALARLRDDASLRETLGRANQAKALSQFDQATMIARYDGLFQLHRRRDRRSDRAGQ